MKNKFIIVMAVILIVVLCGCSSKPKTLENGAVLSDDGRYAGGYESCGIGEILTNMFFSISLDEAKEIDELTIGENTYAPVDGQIYILCKFTIENVYGTDLTMSIGDMPISWDKPVTDEYPECIAYGYGYDDIGDDEYFEDQFLLHNNEKISKYVLYSVPVADKYKISYTEKWEDNFEGNTYEIIFQPTRITESKEDETSVESSENIIEEEVESKEQPMVDMD